MSNPDIRVSEWSSQNDQRGTSQHLLFNSNSLATAGRLDGNDPFCISIDGKEYLAFKRHASAVLGGLSLNDMSSLLSNTCHVKAILAPLGIRSMSLSSWNAENNPYTLRQLLGQPRQIRFEFLLDTDQYSINKISSNHKRNIRKSTKSNVQILLPADRTAIQNHIELVNSNLATKGIGGLTNSPEYFQSLLEQKAGLLVQAKEGDQLLASTFFYTNRDYCYYHSSGTDERGKQIGAAHFLVDHMVAEMRSRGIRFLNLGGCTSDQTGLYRFKLGFRPETRILVATNRRLVYNGKRKLRSLLSVRTKDILDTRHLKVFEKNTGKNSAGTEQDYLFKKMSFDELFDAVAGNPEFSPSLSQFCLTDLICYGLYSKQDKLIAIGLINNPETRCNVTTADRRTTSESAEIIDIYVLREMRNRGVGRLLLAFMEEEVFRLGFRRVCSRVDAYDVAANAIFSARGFIEKGSEISITSGLIGDKKYILKKAKA